MATIFGFEVDAIENVDESSIYIYYLTPSAEAASGARPAAMPAIQPGALAMQIHMAQALGRTATITIDEPFRSNLVVTRQKTELSLGDFAALQRKGLFEQSDKYTLLNESPYSMPGLQALQAEFRVSLEEPVHLLLLQWQVLAVRDGYAYCFFTTSTSSLWEQDKARAEKVLQSIR